jgi:hypothetical protein
MRYEARVTAYDVMDKVHVTLNARDTTATAANDVDVCLNVTVTAAGRGTDRLDVWCREALLALLEAL